jgi:DNA repair exonuclease SbcCD ATPase subunit
MLVQLPLAKETVSKSKKLLAALEANRGALIEKEIALISESQKYESDDKLSEAVVDLKVELGRKRAEWEQYQKQQELLAGIQKKIDACQQKSTGIREKKNKIGKWLSVLKYAQTVFQRNGLPAYLNQQICPELNQAAQEYAELFAQSEIQVRFAVDEEGRLDIQVVNAHGGELVEDQSEGEMKMASLITSFAVRSVAPKTNLLILDEPGAGLDATSARSFARGLRKVVNRFSCILLTTHNQSILSELADVELVTVRKKNRVSEVVE